MDEPQEWIFTFGFGHYHPITKAPLAAHFTRIFGTYRSARVEMARRYGVKWAFQYASEEEAGVQQHELKELVEPRETPPRDAYGVGASLRELALPTPWASIHRAIGIVSGAPADAVADCSATCECSIEDLWECGVPGCPALKEPDYEALGYPETRHGYHDEVDAIALVAANPITPWLRSFMEPDELPIKKTMPSSIGVDDATTDC
jgi:hypothetical protein